MELRTSCYADYEYVICFREIRIKSGSNLTSKCTIIVHDSLLHRETNTSYFYSLQKKSHKFRDDMNRILDNGFSISVFVL